MADEKPKGLGNAFKALKAAAIDLASLEVQTYTGNITVDSAARTGTLTDFKGYLKEIKESDAQLKLVAVTRMEFDGDTINLTSETAPLEHVQKLHDGAVQAGINTRQGLLTLFKELVK